MTNTERLIQSLEHSAKAGTPSVTFTVGRYTGNGPSVVAALRRRGYRVDRVRGTQATYSLHEKAAA